MRNSAAAPGGDETEGLGFGVWEYRGLEIGVQIAPRTEIRWGWWLGTCSPPYATLHASGKTAMK